MAVLALAGPAHAASPESHAGDSARDALPLPAFRGLFGIDDGPAGALPAESSIRHALAQAKHAAEDVEPVAEASAVGAGSPSITWGPLLTQTLTFLVFQHTFRSVFEENTWQKTLEGPFWDDYFQSVGNLCCWVDGDKVTTNYLFHPMLGSGAAFVFANNHRDSKLTPPSMTGTYWSAKGKQGLFALAYSTYFEIGLVLSEAAIGNIGMTGEGMTWQDIIVTPAVGTLFSIGEDVLRSSVIDPIDRWNHFWGATAAIFLNPTRSFSNLMAFRRPWADPPWITLRREARARERVRAEIESIAPRRTAVAVAAR